MWRKGLCCPVGGNITWHSHYGEHDGDSLKTRNKTTIWSSNPLTRQINWENHNYEIHMYCNVHCSTIYNSKYMETKHVSTERWLDKDVVVHKYNGILLSHKKDGICVSCGEMDEPRAWYTEWRKSEREKQIYINEYIYGIWKNGTDKPICMEGMKTLDDLGGRLQGAWKGGSRGRRYVYSYN